MSKNKQITVLEETIRVQKISEEDFISLTDIAKHRNPDAPTDIVKNWLRNKNTIELLGLWEKLHNPNFKQVEFDQFRNEYRIHTDAIKENLIPPELTKQQINLVYASEADILNIALFGKTAKQWRDENPKEKGNIRDFANVSQLVCLANLENLNAHFIGQGLSQAERLKLLNNTAIQQMRLLTEDKMINQIEGQ
jgi:hypothetical protein